MTTNEFVDFKINAIKETLNLPEFDDFLETLRGSVSELCKSAPHDAFVTVDVERHGGGYKIMIRVASSVLNFFEVGEGRSPFFALDNVLMKASEALRVWSINRKF